MTDQGELFAGPAAPKVPRGAPVQDLDKLRARCRTMSLLDLMKEMGRIRRRVYGMMMAEAAKANVVDRHS